MRRTPRELPPHPYRRTQGIPSQVRLPAPRRQPQQPRKHGLYAANFELSGDLKRQAEQDAIRAAACFDDPAFKTLAAERAWLRGRKYYFFLLLVAFFKKYDAAPNRFSARSGNLLRRCLRPHGTPSLLPRSCTASTPQESNSTRTGASGSPDPLPPRCHGA
ncbi:MAG: hypothetical protein HY821_21715 [Acidobacteria bacterium]|nr:hypothetical protein [Acidobacteriota bacterium]